MASPCNNSPDEVIEKIVSAKANADKFDKFVNGTSTQFVQLGTGNPTPVIRNAVRQIMADAAWAKQFIANAPEGDVSLNNVTVWGGSVSRTLADRAADIINVKDYGAVGNGIADDSDAIQDALDLCEGKTVWFPAGTYLITKTLRIEHGKSRFIGTQATITTGEYDETGIVGFKVVGVSDVTIEGLYFEKMFRGLDVWLSEDPADYPATYSNNISDIRIENCVFDTRKWAMSFIGVYGLTISNVTLNQYRTANWSNRDGVHLHGCVNVLINDVMGTTDDDFIAAFPIETFIASTRTYYGVCDKIFINNCIVNNTRNYPSETGTRSFFATDGCDVSYLDTNNEFSVDNVVISNCSIITDSGCVLRIAGGTKAKYLGSIKFYDCYISRGYIPDKVLNAQNSTMFLVRSSIDELVFDRCKIEIDTRWTQETYPLGLIGVFRDIRRFSMTNGYVKTVKDVLGFDDLNVSGLSSIKEVSIMNCVFEQSNSDNSMIVLQNLRRTIERIKFESVHSETKVSNLIKLRECSVGSISFKDIYDTTRYAVIEIEGSNTSIDAVIVSNVRVEKQLIGNDSNEGYQQSIRVVGDFTNDISPNVFTQNTDYIKVHGVNISSTSWAINSDPGSLARVGSNGNFTLCMMNNNHQWVPIGSSSS